MDPHASSTNSDKRKNKPFMMVVHKRGIKERSKKSFAEKQRDLKKKLLRAGRF
jgi:protein SDA1